MFYSPYPLLIMKSSAVLYELADLRKVWRDQNFSFSPAQQKRYDELVALRRERVKVMEAAS